MIVVLMGVAGAGKTTVGRALAVRLGWEFVDADAFHTTDSIAKMAAGQALTDADRRPWLGRLHRLLAEARRDGRSLVLACSALTKQHRAALLGDERSDLLLVYLQADKATVQERLRSRQHFFPPRLGDSQLATIEPPGPDEHPLVLDAGSDIDTLTERIAQEIEVRHG